MMVTKQKSYNPLSLNTSQVVDTLEIEICKNYNDK